jgi:hypothetical protein
MGCPGEHDYRLATDEDAGSIVRDAAAYAAIRFDGLPELVVDVWHSPGAAEPPEYTLGPAGEPAIYLSHSTSDQGAFQAGHEVFHAYFTPVDTHHWVHEMLAARFSLDFLAHRGSAEYRQSVLETFEHDGGTNRALLQDDLETTVFDSTFYARAIQLADALVDVIGADRFFELRSAWDGQRSAPDYWAWLDELPSQNRSAAAAASPSRSVAREQRY